MTDNKDFAELIEIKLNTNPHTPKKLSKLLLSFVIVILSFYTL